MKHKKTTLQVIIIFNFNRLKSLFPKTIQQMCKNKNIQPTESQTNQETVHQIFDELQLFHCVREVNVFFRTQQHADCLTRQNIVNSCGDVYVLQVLHGLRVEEAQCRAGAERDPDAHPRHHHVRHHHALLLVGLQLPLDEHRTRLCSLAIIHNILTTLRIR